MSLTMDEAQLAEYCRRTGMKNPLGDGAPKPAKQNKYKNEPTVVDGHRFPSKREAGRWLDLKLLLRAGEVCAVMKQVPFLLPGGDKYVADFVILNKDGTYTVEDAKGMPTPEYKRKKKQMREHWGIEIVEV